MSKSAPKNRKKNINNQICRPCRRVQQDVSLFNINAFPCAIFCIFIVSNLHFRGLKRPICLAIFQNRLHLITHFPPKKQYNHSPIPRSLSPSVTGGMRRWFFMFTFGKEYTHLSRSLSRPVQKAVRR